LSAVESQRNHQFTFIVAAAFERTAFGFRQSATFDLKLVLSVRFRGRGVYVQVACHLDSGSILFRFEFMATGLTLVLSNMGNVFTGSRTPGILITFAAIFAVQYTEEDGRNLLEWGYL
jgi:hypothetical protein